MNTTQSHNYDNLSFDITKQDDSVMITCIDKVMHKSYQEIFERGYIVDVLSLNNVNNFYNVLNNAFEKRELTISSNCDIIDVHIQTNIFFITFDINFSLRLMDQSELSTTSIYIEKLHKKIKRLEDVVYNQQVIVAVAYTYCSFSPFTCCVCTNVVNNVIFNLSPNQILVHVERSGPYYGRVVFDNGELTISLGNNPGTPNTSWCLLPTLHAVRTKNMTFLNGIDKTKLNMSQFPVPYEEDEF